MKSVGSEAKNGPLFCSLVELPRLSLIFGGQEWLSALLQGLQVGSLPPEESNNQSLFLQVG